MTGWYARFAASLAGTEPVPDPLPRDEVADGRLVDAVGRDLRDSDGHATAIGVRVIWTGDHLDAVRVLQGSLVGPARAASEQHALASRLLPWFAPRSRHGRPQPPVPGRSRH